MEILCVDEQSGQILINNKAQIMEALTQKGDKEQRDKFMKQLENAHFKITKNKLQVVLEEYTEEDASGDEGGSATKSQISQ